MCRGVALFQRLGPKGSVLCWEVPQCLSVALVLVFQGVNMKLELSQLIGELPEVYSQVLQALPELIPVITFYQTFLQSIGRWVPRS